MRNSVERGILIVSIRVVLQCRNRECEKPPGLLLVLDKNLEKVSVRYLSAGVSTSDQNGPRGLAYEDLQR